MVRVGPKLYVYPMKAKDNPFATCHLGALRFRFSEQSWTSLETRWRDGGYKGAITGPFGVGKTALLKEWKTRLHEQSETAALLRYRLGAPIKPLREECLFHLRRNEIIFIDDAGNLGSCKLRWLTRGFPASAKWVITGPSARFLPTIYEMRGSLDLFKELMNELCPDHGMNEQDLYARAEGNIRDAFLIAYSEIATKSASSCC